MGGRLPELHRGHAGDHEGFLDHLHTRDTTYAMVSRAPLEKLERWKAKQGWEHIPWYSSAGTDFNYDFGVTIDASRGFDTYNYRTLDEYAAMGREHEDSSSRTTCRDRAASCASTTASSTRTPCTPAGLESTGGSYYFLDLTALGRQEDWEEPKGRSESLRTNQPDFAE